TRVLRAQRTSKARHLVAYIAWAFFGTRSACATETGRFHRTSPAGNGGVVLNGRERPRRGAVRGQNETSDRACGKRRFDTFDPNALDTADRLDGNGRPAAAPRVREFSGAALGPWSIAPARNGGTGLPRRGARPADPTDAHGIFAAFVD